MKIKEKISWLMGRVQGSLFPHLNECLRAPLTTQEKRLVSILEIVQVERYVQKNVPSYRFSGRNPLDRQSLARAFVAKALYRHPTTGDLIRALNSAENLRRICGFMTLKQSLWRLHFHGPLPNFPAAVMAAGYTMPW